MLLFTFHISFFYISCGGGDDDGRRLGELIVGTWYRGWAKGDVVIEGDTALEPENFSYYSFEFRPDGSYNGMVRKGSFASYDKMGEEIMNGSYTCDNDNLKLESLGDGYKLTILAQVVSFDDDKIIIRYEYEEANITVTMTLYSSSSSTSSE